MGRLSKAIFWSSDASERQQIVPGTSGPLCAPAGYPVQFLFDVWTAHSHLDSSDHLDDCRSGHLLWIQCPQQQAESHWC